ncbi:MAG: hypothetical protein AAGF89_14510 [Bacteroidota bacterium]
MKLIYALFLLLVLFFELPAQQASWHLAPELGLTSMKQITRFSTEFYPSVGDIETTFSLVSTYRL